jgi:hypothetical protein
MNLVSKINNLSYIISLPENLHLAVLNLIQTGSD